MAALKKVQVEARMGDKFTIESKIRDHVVYVDQPKSNGGEDTGPTALECLLLCLAGCVASIGRIIANQQKIALRAMTVTVEGELDMETLMGKSRENRAGFQGIKVTVKVDADMSLEEKKKFLHDIDLRCPVSDNLRDKTSITMEVVQ